MICIRQEMRSSSQDGLKTVNVCAMAGSTPHLQNSLWLNILTLKEFHHWLDVIIHTQMPCLHSVGETGHPLGVCMS